MPKEKPQFSVIIPSFNRSDELEDLLNSLNEQDFPSDSFEIIVSDDGSTDSTEQLVKRFAKTLRPNLIYMTQENNGPGAARNHGMENANSDFFIFVDSDVTMPANWLSNISKQIKKENADAFGGPDTFRVDFPPLAESY